MFVRCAVMMEDVPMLRGAQKSEQQITNCQITNCQKCGEYSSNDNATIKLRKETRIAYKLLNSRYEPHRTIYSSATRSSRIGKFG